MNKNLQEDYIVLLEKYEELLAASQYRRNIGSRFIQKMRYDFNTALNLVSGSISALYESLGQIHKSTFEDIQKSSKLLSDKIGTASDYILLIVGGYEVTSSPASLRLILRQIHRKYADLLSEKRLQYVFSIDGAIPKDIETDSGIVKKVISCLIEDAAKNSSGGMIRAKISLYKKDDQVLTLKFTVFCEGMSTDVEKMSLFLSGSEVFDTKKGEPDRFELQIAKDYLELMGSSLFIEKDLERGTGFSFFLNVEELGAGIRPHTEIDESDDRGALVGTKILLTDDSVIMQRIVRQMLENEGAAVTAASNGEEAFELCSKNNYDVVLMDVEMPVLNGYGAAERIISLNDVTGFSAPIIGMTAHTSEEEYEKCIKCGMKSVIYKPFGYRELNKAIYKTLYNREYVSQAKETSEKHSIYDFACIVGIDYRQALQRLGGNDRVYFELLQNFRDSYSDVDENISTLLIEGSDAEVKSLLHLIKGISGHLSLNEIYNYANRLRNALENDNLAEITEYLKLFGDAVSEFKESFASVELQSLYRASENIDMDLMLVKGRMQELLESISGDIDLGNAFDACDDISDYMMRTGDKDDFIRVRNALNELDISLAETLLSAFMSRFNKS